MNTNRSLHAQYDWGIPILAVSIESKAGQIIYQKEYLLLMSQGTDV